MGVWSKCLRLPVGLLLLATSQVWAQVPVQNDALLKADDVVARRGGVALTVDHLDQRILEMPAHIRAGYFDDAGRVGRLVDTALLALQLAHEAEAAGIVVELPPNASEVERARAMANELLRRQGVLQPDEEYALLAEERYRSRKKEYASPEAYTLQHIFVSASPRGQMAAKVIADAARQKAVDGEDFTALIKEYSDFKDGDALNATIIIQDALRLPMPLQHAIAAFDQKPGISAVIESPNAQGYHIVRLVEYHPPRVPPFDAIKDKIVEDLKAEAVHSSRTTFMRSLSLQDVELNDPIIQKLADYFQEKYGDH